jgi:protein TonB
MKKFLIISILIHLAGFTLAALYLDDFVNWSAGKKAGTVMLVELSPVTVSKDLALATPQQKSPAPPKSKKIVKLQVPDKDAEEMLEQEKIKEEAKPQELKTKEPKQQETKQTQVKSTPSIGKEETTMAALSKQKEGITQKPSDLEGASRTPYDTSSIYSIILAQIERNKYYPIMARKRGIEGTTKVTFKIKKDGSVAVVKITKPSGAKILDDAAVDTIRKASPFPYVPNPITVPITFNLRDQI